MAVEDLYRKACDAVERANYDYAVELFREVLRQDPQYPDARIALRGTERRRLQEKGRSPLALVFALPRRLVATLKAATGKAPKRLEIYEDYLRTSPSSFWALTGVARALVKMGVNAEAVLVYKDALKLKQNNKGVLRALGDLLTEADEHQDAARFLSRLSALEPNNRDLQKEVRDLAAVQHMVSHDMEGAESFRDLVRDKDEVDRLEQDARMDVSIDDLHRRIDEAEKGVVEHPDNVTRILGLAALYVGTEQLGKAQKLLREKYQAMPDNYEIRERLGDVQLGVYDAAITKATAALAADANDEAAAAKKADLEKRRSQFAIKDYTWRLKQHPNDHETQVALGQAQYDAGNDNEAIAAFQAAAQDARFEVESWRMLGLCFMRKGQQDLALEQFVRAAERHPDMDEQGKELRYCQAQANEDMGNTAEALDLYKRIYSTDINYRDVAQKVDALSG